MMNRYILLFLVSISLCFSGCEEDPVYTNPVEMCAYFPMDLSNGMIISVAIAQQLPLPTKQLQ